MHTFVLQDWITIRGQLGTGGPPPPASQTIVQTATDWLDLTPFQDLFAWVSVSEITTGTSGRVDLYFDTSPTDDESLFQSMTGGGSPGTPAIQGLTATAIPTVVKLPMLSAAIPLSRFLRWRLYNATASDKWDVTMRIVVAANSPGM